MTTLHVVPDQRGRWRVFEDEGPAPVSEHASATDAERRAWSQLYAGGGDEIVVHDRYGRTRPAVEFLPRDRARAAAPGADALDGLAGLA